MFSTSKRENEFDQVIAQSARVPGPAQYDRDSSATKKDVGPSFGSKRVEKLSLNPGPGQYDIAAGDTLRRPQTAKAQAFSLSKRPDIWKEEK